MKITVSIRNIYIVTRVIERPLKKLYTNHECTELSDIVQNLQLSDVKYVSSQPSSILFTKIFQALCYLGEIIRRYGILKMLEDGPHQN